MFARRGFLYKRQNVAHLAAASQLNSPSPVVVNPASAASPSTPADPKTSDAINPLTPVVPTQTTNAAPTPSTSPAASSPTPSTSNPLKSSSSSSSASSTSSTSGSSSATHTTTSALSTPPTVAASTPIYASSVSTQVVPGVSPTYSSAVSPTTTSTTGSSGTNTSAIVGGIAGTLAGIAILGFLLMWCMRRQRSRDIDDFDAQAFKRQSAMLVDEPVEPSRSYNPRPPTMIERHNTSHALATQAGYGGQNFYGGYGAYGQQPPYEHPEMIQSTGSPPPQAYGAQPMGYGGYHGPQQQLVRQPSNAQYLTRQPTSAAGYAPAPPPVPHGSLDTNAQYIDLNRSSISPYQAAQYADISRQLGTTDSNTHVPHESMDLPEGPLPSPFDNPVETHVSPHAHLDHPTDMVATGPIAATPASQAQGERPMTVYGESDPYGGI